MPTDQHAWREHAACFHSDLEPDTWLEYPGGKAVPVEAVRICVGCPVRRACLEYALTLSTNDDTGIWGGTTEKGRRDIRYRGLSPRAAMARGDEIARQRTRGERIAEDEPWLVEASA